MIQSSHQLGKMRGKWNNRSLKELQKSTKTFAEQKSFSSAHKLLLTTTDARSPGRKFV